MIYKLYSKSSSPYYKDAFPSKNTNICIAAYPRSGSDFSKQLTKNYFPGIKISSHFHKAGAFKYSIRIGVPVIGLIRDPIECVSSAMVKYRTERSLDFFPKYPMYEYLTFHKEMLKQAQKISIINFDDLIEDPLIYITKLERLLSTNSERNLEINEVIEIVSNKLNNAKLACNQSTGLMKGPSKSKEDLKRQAKKILNQSVTFKKKSFKLYEDLLKFS
tara:strand:- start:160 stop:813 length:654 start_codon:yes stop_codon:yes gene_type:complete